MKLRIITKKMISIKQKTFPKIDFTAFFLHKDNPPAWELTIIKSPFHPHLIITLPTHNKHIFVRPKKCAYWGKSAYLGKECLFWEVENFAS